MNVSKRDWIIANYDRLKAQGVIKSQNTAAKALGLSATALSQYFAGKYMGDIDSVERSLEKYINLLLTRQITNTTRKVWVDTQNSNTVLAICQRVHVHVSFGVVTGRAGVGKTEALKRYAKENPDVIYLEVDTAFSPRELMKAILKTLGGDFKGSINELKIAVINRLKDSGRMIIVDQAEYLNERALDLLRTVHDQANVGILLAGMHRLYQNLYGTKGVNEQILTRVGAYANLEALPEADVDKIVTAHFPELEDEDLRQLFYTSCKGNTRRLTLLIKNVQLNQQSRVGVTDSLFLDEKTIASANAILL
ncbi:MAG: AAA family ATPase [Ignavibacteriales bacterium]|nr:MAG: AAA family ATPase [Ignavibacteriaceae bacterium]MBW7872863.1 AAA family ATPase [Ignavibacteria bacterium]MCZ2143583.1 AAA family ATPase [Ignavibacteriales bacterium]MBV6444458.1 hypothetical protein [Ignavibacteriaceae bacterium]MBZ0197263.1 AAA family ATPase [Ignavibacteriaceae bacterium]